MDSRYKTGYGPKSPTLDILEEDPFDSRPVVTYPSFETKTIELRDPIDAISCNKDQDKIVVAGSRGVLQIFQVTETSLVAQVDLKKVANKNKNKSPLLYSPSNVAWSKLDDHLIATTSTMGAVVLWNLAGLKIESSWKAHGRSATVVRFHRINPHILISGSRDFCIYVYDTREKEPVAAFKKGITETIWDLNFSSIEGDEHFFLSGDEGGLLKIWDLRNTDRPLRSRNLHDGRISSIQANPKRPYEVATGGGRDKAVHIYNWRENRKKRGVETYAPVGRVQWRPDNEFQLATCAVVNDMSVLVWDIRRPHLPMISFPGHKDSATDVFWSRHQPEKFISSGKDGNLMLHSFIEGDHTIDHLCDAQIDVAPDGLLVIGLNSKNESKKSPKWESGPEMQLNKMRKSSDKRKEAVANQLRQMRLKWPSLHSYEPFSQNVQSDVVVGIPSSAQSCLQSNLFEFYAKNFIIGGSKISDMCEHNAVICRGAGDEVRERLWRFVAGLLADAKFQDVYDKDEKNSKETEQKQWQIYIKEHENYGSVPLVPPVPKPDLPFNFLVHQGQLETKIIEEKQRENDSEEEYPFFRYRRRRIEVINAHMDHLKSEVPSGDEFCGLPQEAFGIKRYFQDPTCTLTTIENSWRSEKCREDYDPVNVLIRTLHYLAHLGDMQMCASIATIAGHLLGQKLTDFFIEAWAQSYMDMLYRLRLFAEIAMIRKFTIAKRIIEEAGEGIYQRPFITHGRRNPQWGDPTLMKSKNPPKQYTLCHGKLKNGNCDKCKEAIIPICCLCDQSIPGLLWNCRKCNHSMHMDHALLWFRKRIYFEDYSGFDQVVKYGHPRRKKFLFNGDQVQPFDMSFKYCPVRGCGCKCLNKNLDEEERRSRINNKTQSVTLIEKQIEMANMKDTTEFKRRRNDFIKWWRWKKRIDRWDTLENGHDQLMRKKVLTLCHMGKITIHDVHEYNKKTKKEQDWWEKKYGHLRRPRRELVFTKTRYDCVLEPEKEKILKEMRAAAETMDELRLCKLVKMIMILPNNYLEFIRNHIQKQNDAMRKKKTTGGAESEVKKKEENETPKDLKDRKKVLRKRRDFPKRGYQKDEKENKPARNPYDHPPVTGPGSEKLPLCVRLGLTTMASVEKSRADRVAAGEKLPTAEEKAKKMEKICEGYKRQMREEWRPTHIRKIDSSSSDTDDTVYTIESTPEGTEDEEKEGKKIEEEEDSLWGSPRSINSVLDAHLLTKGKKKKKRLESDVVNNTVESFCNNWKATLKKEQEKKKELRHFRMWKLKHLKELIKNSEGEEKKKLLHMMIKILAEISDEKEHYVNNLTKSLKNWSGYAMRLISFFTLRRRMQFFRDEDGTFWRWNKRIRAYLPVTSTNFSWIRKVKRIRTVKLRYSHDYNSAYHASRSAPRPGKNIRLPTIHEDEAKEKREKQKRSFRFNGKLMPQAVNKRLEALQAQILQEQKLPQPNRTRGISEPVIRPANQPPNFGRQVSQPTMPSAKRAELPTRKISQPLPKTTTLLEPRKEDKKAWRKLPPRSPRREKIFEESPPNISDNLEILPLPTKFDLIPGPPMRLPAPPPPPPPPSRSVSNRETRPKLKRSCDDTGLQG